MRRKRLSWVLLLISIGLIVIGVGVGEYWSVLEKAVTVCLSCIGIG